MPYRYRTLTVRWMARFRDYRIFYPRRCDGHLISNALFSKRMGLSGLHGPLEKSLMEELEARGYDLTTLVFQCQLKKDTIV